MTVMNDVKNKAQEIKGKVRQLVGRATGNRRLERQGQTDEVKGDLKQAGENIKDALNP